MHTYFKAYILKEHHLVHLSMPKPHQFLPLNPGAVRGSFQCLAAFLVIGLVYLSRNFRLIWLDGQLQPPERIATATATVAATAAAIDQLLFLNDTIVTQRSSVSSSSSSSSLLSSGCDLFSGKWVYDDASYPLYKDRECSFMSDQLACEKYGRKDLSYQHWRWQPDYCDLPRFNATALLEMLRNKRMVYVGDSLNRGQWVSMVCLIDTAVPSSSHKSIDYRLNGSLIVFNVVEYNATIEFYWAPLLVESNSDDPVHHKLPDRIVRVQAIEKHARHWSDAHVLVFDSYLWWRRETMKVLWGSFGDENGVYKQMKMLRSYEMALQTWADWLEVHTDPRTTRVFWVSMSPTHERSQEWGGPAGGNCYNQTGLIARPDYWGSGSDPTMMRAVEAAVDRLRKVGLRAQILNITQLSEYRKEAHPSVHRKQWEPLTQAQLSDPLGYADCCHWCLPGVPDTWNELLYAMLMDS